MGEKETSHRMCVGEKFFSFQEFLDEKNKYEKIVKQVYTINGNQRRLNSKHCKLLNANQACVYQKVTVSCKYGKKKEESQATLRDAKYVSF